MKMKPLHLLCREFCYRQQVKAITGPSYFNLRIAQDGGKVCTVTRDQ